MGGRCFRSGLPRARWPLIHRVGADARLLILRAGILLLRVVVNARLLILVLLLMRGFLILRVVVAAVLLILQIGLRICKQRPSGNARAATTTLWGKDIL